MWNLKVFAFFWHYFLDLLFFPDSINKITVDDSSEQKSQIVSFLPNKPSTTVSTVQPQPSQIQKTLSISTDDSNKDMLPQVPPRIHSQTSGQPTKGPPGIY